VGQVRCVCVPCDAGGAGQDPARMHVYRHCLMPASRPRGGKWHTNGYCSPAAPHASARSCHTGCALTGRPCAHCVGGSGGQGVSPAPRRKQSQKRCAHALLLSVDVAGCVLEVGCMQLCPIICTNCPTHLSTASAWYIATAATRCTSSGLQAGDDT
jgi:hypothetical protein